ncbi:MAG: NADH-quinone oxidoreductase subunit C [Phycisphaerae bacterium]|nr:NADH-quinone oxidoreductase subunit C [Phycisphaerae bacterium]
MTPEAITEILKEKFGDKITGASFDGAHPHVTIAAAAWPDVARFMKDDERLHFNVLRCISSVDMPDDKELLAVYDMYSCDGEPDSTELWTKRHEFCVKIKVPRDDPHIPSVASVWPTAEWHEREAYDMMGIIIDGNPDSIDSPEGRHPRRILCPDDWEGHPLRKDYVFPMEYHGIPAVTEYEQTRPMH